MAHELETINGRTSFAYNGSENPWHKLGQPMQGLQTASAMLEAAQADYTVSTAPIYTMTEDGMIELDSHVATVRTVEAGDDRPADEKVMGVVGSGYQVVQNETALDLALRIVGADPNEDAVVDTCGVLFGGRRFFAYIDLGTLDLDPQGVNDRITRGLGVLTSHDGTQAVTFAMSNLRWVCNNTVTAGLARAASTFRARHTQNVEISLNEARKVLGVSLGWAARFAEQAEAMLRVNDGMSDGRAHDLLTKLERELWPISDDPTTRVENNAERRRASLHKLLDSPTCIPAVGANGWAVYNAVTEYLDHQRPTMNAQRRAEAAILGSSDELKVKAAAKVMALA
jgi:phage/plasmid-like protein (TIGR03299 family)